MGPTAYRIFVGSFQCESNTFCKTIAKYEDFDIFYDEAVPAKLAATKVFTDNGFDVVPGLFASALPSGKVALQAFEKIADEMLLRLKNNAAVDGIYLYLHGAMFVDGLGSGEAQLVRLIRDIVGDGIPIALALDFHANNTDDLVKSVNIIQGFRTAPHTDHDATEQRAATGLVRCISDHVLPKPVLVRVPVLAADAAVTASSPLKDIMEKLYELDNRPEVYSAAFFNGQPWVDMPYVGPNAVIMVKDEDEKVYLEEAQKLAKMYWQGRDELKLGKEAMMPDEAIEYACGLNSSPVFITDSGDNTTAGAEGEGTLLLHKLVSHKVKRALICGITAKDTVAALLRQKIGDTVDIRLSEHAGESNSVAVQLRGVIKSFGKVLGWAGEECGCGVVVSTGDIDVVLTDVRAAFISQKHIENMGVHVSDYHIIVVKLGYLFPELKQIASEHVFALTSGASTNLFDTLEYNNIRRPMYPLDRKFGWE